MIDPLVRHIKPYSDEQQVNGRCLWVWIVLFVISLLFVDSAALSQMAALRGQDVYHNTIHPLMEGITTLGMARLYLVPCCVLTLVVLWKERRHPLSVLLRPLPALPFFMQVLLVLPVMLFLAKMAKILIGHARPKTLLDMPSVPPFWEQYHGLMTQDAFHGLPSGHTTTAVTLAILAARFYPRLALPVYGAAGAVMISRVFLLEHEVSDVVGTVVFVMILLPLITRIWDRLRGLVVVKRGG
ncbi:MAG: phosphatase PAP2 family protein [Alphaproteobacteria bacterium]